MKHEIDLVVNGTPRRVLVGPEEFLADVLRDHLRLTGTRVACNQGVCGSCTVLVDGLPVSSCLTLAVRVAGRAIQTIEGFAGAEGLHPIQEAFLDQGAVQCGFCTSGMVLTAAAFLRETLHPTREQIREALAGNLCRCTGYAKIIEGVADAVGRLRHAAGRKEEAAGG